MSNTQGTFDHPHDYLMAGDDALENKDWKLANKMYHQCLQHKHNLAYDKSTIRNHVTGIITHWHSDKQFDDCITAMERVLSEYLESQEARVLLRRIIDIVNGEKRGSKDFIEDPDRPGYALSVAGGLADIAFK